MAVNVTNSVKDKDLETPIDVAASKKLLVRVTKNTLSNITFTYFNITLFK